METHDLVTLPAVDMAQRFRQRTLLPMDALEAVREQVGRVNPSINAIVALDWEGATAAAEDAERDFAAMTSEQLADRPLLGIPVTLKDVMPVRGMPNTLGSLLFRDNVSHTDGPLAAKLRRAGAVIIGKTNTPEFGWKGDTNNRVYGPTKNPWDATRTAGGSSGGSAAAVATGMAPLSVGTDGAGSIRIPASFCGVVGFKPTFGLVPYSPASAVELLAHAGPITRTVADAAFLLDVLAGLDLRDRNSVAPSESQYLARCAQPLGEVRIGYSSDLGFATVDPEIASITSQTVALLRGELRRFRQTDVHLDDPADAVALFFASGIAARLEAQPDGWRELIDPGLLRVVDAFAHRTARDVARALTARALVNAAFQRVFEDIDVLITPTMPVAAFPLGQDVPAPATAGVEDFLSWTQLTYPFNLTGQPAITIPVGLTSAGLPVGIQLIGRRFEDGLVLQVARAIEQALPPMPRPSQM